MIWVRFLVDIPLTGGRPFLADSDNPPRHGETSAVSSTSNADATFRLLERARGGDQDALDQLFARYIPLLRRWASGRLPHWARDLTETADLVQDTVLAVFKKVEDFEPRGEGALQAYLRQALLAPFRK